MICTMKDQILPYLIDPAGVPRHTSPQKTSSGLPYSTPAGRPCNWSFTNSIAGGKHLRELHRQRQLLASLGENGQQTPIVVVIAKTIAPAIW